MTSDVVTSDVVTIAGAAGAWGDTLLSTPQLLASRQCDYIIYEALAEVTMGILTRQKLADPSRGYATDIIDTICSHLSEYANQGIKVVTNAGGVNPLDAAERIRAAAQDAGLGISVAAITGDDLMPHLADLRRLHLTEMSDDTPLESDPLSFNVYLGAQPIAAALRAGADLVVTGRCVDSALALGPLLHEFDWQDSDWDCLSAGSLAGHLIECGPQSTGGLFTDWEAVGSWANIGYPLAECRPDGSFVLTKPTATGGLVDNATVAEQLLYEIDDPRAYRLPDVTCDWSQVRLTRVGQHRVKVTGARGRPAPPMLKACSQVLDGFRATMMAFVAGRQAVPKARRLANDVLTRARAILDRIGAPELASTDFEILGSEATYGRHGRAEHVREVILKLGLHHKDPNALRAVVRDIPSFGLAVPGMSGGAAGVPHPSPRLQLRCYLVPRHLVSAYVVFDGKSFPVDRPSDDAVASEFDVAALGPDHSKDGSGCAPPDGEISVPGGAHPRGDVTVPLVAIAHGRSGDKGRDVNVGIRARHSEFLQAVRAQVTSESAGSYLAHLGAHRVDRYELPGIDAINLHFRGALGGGGLASLRIDPQGKAIAQQLLEMPVVIPQTWLVHPAINCIPEIAELSNQLFGSDRPDPCAKKQL